MPATITAFLPMTFVCRWHTDCELEVFQPVNQVTYVGSCIKCQQKHDAELNAVKNLQVLTERIENRGNARRKRTTLKGGKK